MEVTASRERVREMCAQARARGARVGFVPTMGDLHEGHRSLLQAARRDTGFTTLSAFVNPLQFDSSGDLAAYPRVPDRDRAVAETLGIDLLFTPGDVDMYPDGRPEVTVDPGPLGERLEGASRPGHFRGVLTVVAKLFALVGPSHAYFGEKDAQQLALVGRMVVDLDLPIRIIGCPTVREPDGLAISSRNRRLSPDQRAAAPVLFEALSDAATLVRQGERDANALRAEMAKRIGGEPLARLDYVAVVDEATWEDVDAVAGPARALVAARLGETRLIDNLLLPWPPTHLAVQNTIGG